MTSSSPHPPLIVAPGHWLQCGHGGQWTSRLGTRWPPAHCPVARSCSGCSDRNSEHTLFPSTPLTAQSYLIYPSKAFQLNIICREQGEQAEDHLEIHHGWSCTHTESWTACHAVSNVSMGLSRASPGSSGSSAPAPHPTARSLKALAQNSNSSSSAAR